MQHNAQLDTIGQGLERVVQALNLGVTVADEAGQIVFMNDTDVAMHGYETGDLDGAPARVLGPHDGDANRPPGSPQEVPRWCRHTRNARKDGVEFPVRLYSEVLFDKRGKPVGRVTLCKDLTDGTASVCSASGGRCGLPEPCEAGAFGADCHLSAAAVEARMTADPDADAWAPGRIAALGRWASGLAHDFRNSLMVILGMVDLVEQRLPSDMSDVAAMLESIRGSARRSEDLVARLHDVGRRRPLSLKGVDLRDAVQTLATTFTPLLPPTIRLRLEHAPEAPVAHADANAIQEILLNLISNAHDAMPDGGTLTLETGSHVHTGDGQMPTTLRKGVRYAAVSVADTGEGMDGETVRRLFEPFFTTKPPGQGTGLGMMMVASLMDAQGGTIHVESQPGTGTRITLLLPEARGQNQAV